ncbi:MAG TPA: zf-HC2 domain-containing protein [Thermoanaerobaculia bacterium]|nr:zf-HC2 domain-containing protein [Thermoanaerobaculia bacterium]
MSSAEPAERLRAHFKRERRAIDQHPTPERIVAYHECRLVPDEAEEIRAHLVACPDCTAELLDLAALLEGEDDATSEISPAELDAAWQRQRARRLPDRPAAPPERPWHRPAPPRRAWATAAVLGLAAALLAVVALDQRRTIALLQQPQANPPLVNLEPVDSVRQGLREAPELRLPAQGERIWMILNPSAELAASTYGIEVVAPDGAVVIRLEDIPSSEAGNFRLEIPRGALEAGSYRVLLEESTSGERRIVEEFALRVRPAAP